MGRLPSFVRMAASQWRVVWQYWQTHRRWHCYNPGIALHHRFYLSWLKPKQKRLLRFSLQWHDKIGRYTIMLTLLIALTGPVPCPPVMIALVLNKMPSIPGTTLHSKNPWNDKLRVVRYDEKFGDWLLSTSDGFFSCEFPDRKVGVHLQILHQSVLWD